MYTTPIFGTPLLNVLQIIAFIGASGILTAVLHTISPITVAGTQPELRACYTRHALTFTFPFAVCNHIADND